MDHGDSLFYQNKSNYKVLDFRQKKSKGEFDQRQQYIKVQKGNSSAIIEIKGIDNGISIEIIFNKVNECWMLVEISDHST
jgi:hypothetical protein